MQSSYVIDLAQFDNGRDDFEAHYCLSNYDTNFGGQDFKVSWDDFYTCIDDYSTNNNIPESEIAIRLVICYDTSNNILYLRMQLCKLVSTTDKSHGRDIYDLDTQDVDWYELREDDVSTTTTTDLSDSDYLDYFYYSSTPLPTTDPLEKLADGTTNEYVENTTFPWSQILDMYEDNGSPDDVYLHFASCSYTEVYSGDSGVTWPHMLVLYLSDESGNLLDNIADPTDIFLNKGADFATLCPPNCNIYIDAS